ncbi:hypothetical protein OOP60_005094 [Salmonella enterica]|nr:hypothetical protein [Salmonella enterica]EKB5476657.1 hypothetical protein [Salmonella enterica]ELL0516406.1 hypothetical protein [Salmonella enterica]
MPKLITAPISLTRITDWITIHEAATLITQLINDSFTESDIYRYALSGKIRLSIYFQSPVYLRKTTQTTKNKIKLRNSDTSLSHRLCYLDSTCFVNKMNFITSTEGKYILSTYNIIDTPLSGYEFVVLQRLLARSLGIPTPRKRKYCLNYGISVLIDGKIFQIFEKMTWQERIKQQLSKFPQYLSQDIQEKISKSNINNLFLQEYFPLYDLPTDACFVIRRTELEKLLTLYTPAPVSTRTSSALALFFWLACRRNESIRSLIGQPYKLLTIFEQWAKEEGITDHLSGDTLKAALERGCPFPDSQRR